MITVGEILQKQRLKKNLTISDIEKKTKIRAKYLLALEKNNFSFFSSKIYIIGVIKNYSRILGLDEKKVLAVFIRDYEKKEEISFKKKINEDYLKPEAKKILRVIFIFLGTIFLIYFFYQIYIYFSPPKLEILSPKQTVFKTEEKIKIIGKTDKEALIIIGNQRIYQNKEGVFEYDFPLKKGENILKIELTGVNGRKSIIEKKYIKEL